MPISATLEGVDTADVYTQVQSPAQSSDESGPDNRLLSTSQSPVADFQFA